MKTHDQVYEEVTELATKLHELQTELEALNATLSPTSYLDVHKSHLHLAAALDEIRRGARILQEFTLS